MNLSSTAPPETMPESTTRTHGSRNFLFFGVLVFLLFITESIFFAVAFQLPDDRLPELRSPAHVTPALLSNAQPDDDGVP